MKEISEKDYNDTLQALKKANKLIQEQELKIDFLTMENKNLIDFKTELIDFLRDRFRVYNTNYYSESNRKRASTWLNSAETIQEVLQKIMPNHF